MKIVFFGTPYYVVPILEGLHKAFKDRNETPIAAVVTQPPKPAGRKKMLEYSPTDTWAHKREISKYFDPKEIIENDIKADVGVLASYGAMVPKEVVNHFPYGIVVIHPSLLPEFRWGSPVPAAMITGTNPTGTTIIKMDEKWDHGPIITQFEEDVYDNDTYQTLRDRLFEKSTEVLVQMLPSYLRGKIKLRPQDHEKATYARIIKKEDAFIPPDILWSVVSGQWTGDNKKMAVDFIRINEAPFVMHATPATIHRFIRAMDPWPIAWTMVRIKEQEVRIKILKARVEDKKLVPEEVQLEGKNPVSWEQFKAGYPEASFNLD